MIKLLCSRLFSSKKMEPLPKYDKMAAEIFITRTEDRCSASDYKHHESVPKLCRCATLAKIFFIVILCISLSCNIVFVVSVVQRGFQDLTQCDAELKMNEVCLDCKYFEDRARLLRLKKILTYKRRSGKSNEKGDMCCFDYNDSLHEMSKIVCICFMMKVFTTIIYMVCSLGQKFSVGIQKTYMEAIELA